MANVDTEQKASPAQPQPETGPDSVAVIEENLAALLKAVTAPADPAVPPALVPEMTSLPTVEALPTPVISLDASSPVEAPVEPVISVRAEPVSAPADLPKAPEVFTPSETMAGQGNPPAGEPQQQVVSKLALLSSIKQRRNVSAMNTGARADSDSSSTESASPAEPEKPAISQDQPLPETPKKTVENTVKPPFFTVETQRNDAQDKTRSLDATPQPAVFAARSSGTLFASTDESSPAKPKSFVTSGAGITLIAGAVAALGLIGYVLFGPETKPTVASPVPTTKASAQATPQSVPMKTTAVESKAMTIPATSSTAKTTSAPAAKQDPKTQPRTEVQTAKAAAPIAPVNANPPAPASNPAPPARVFTPPSARSRPVADTTIREAPPSLSTSATPIPVLGALPSNIAPPPPVATKPSAPREIRVPGKVQAGRLVRSVTPAYPSLAKATRVQGLVRFRVTIGTDGRVNGLMVLGGPPPLVQAAADAVKQWRYQPTVVNGEAVEVVTDIELAFKL